MEITKEIIIGLVIHLFIPLLGIFYFFRLRKKIKNECVPNPPIIELLIIFATYGGLLLVALTALFWKWSGMASLGVFYLIVVAPIIMAYIAFKHRQTKSISKYHKWACILGLLYFVIAPIIIIALFLITKTY